MCADIASHRTRLSQPRMRTCVIPPPPSRCPGAIGAQLPDPSSGGDRGGCGCRTNRVPCSFQQPHRLEHPPSPLDASNPRAANDSEASPARASGSGRPTSSATGRLNATQGLRPLITPRIGTRRMNGNGRRVAVSTVQRATDRGSGLWARDAADGRVDVTRHARAMQRRRLRELLGSTHGVPLCVG